jgi:hypothetical protein
MPNQVAALYSEYLTPKMFRFSRNQMEAGISHLPWEARLRPLRPLSQDIAVGIGVVSMFAAVCLFV